MRMLKYAVSKTLHSQLHFVRFADCVVIDKCSYVMIRFKDVALNYLGAQLYGRRLGGE